MTSSTMRRITAETCGERPWQSKQDEEKRGTFRCRRGGRKHHRAYKRSRRGDDPIHETTTADGLQEIVDVGACEPTSDGIVINISSRVLTSDETTVLGKGLSFCCVTSMNWFDLNLDVQRLFRNLRLKNQFSSQPSRTVAQTTTPGSFSLVGTGLRNKSTYQPPTSNPQIEVFAKLVLKDIEKLRSKTLGNKRRLKNNLNMRERKALNSLAQDDAIVVKPADKGGAIVVMDTSMYTTEVFRQLNDENVYEKLRSDPTIRFQLQLRGMLNEALWAGLIDKKLLKFLDIQHPIVPTLYTLPKVHKDPQNPPGRPIVSGRNSLFCNIARFLDKVLRRFADEADSHIRDTSDFLKKIASFDMTEDVILVTFDVTALYTSISHDKGIDAIRQFLMASDMSSECMQFALSLLEYILRNNYFLFGGVYYRQRQGTAMGSNVAPTYANIFVRQFEEKYIYTSIYAASLVYWGRYIDDVFALWKGSLQTLQEFHTFLNAIYPELQFTMSYSIVEIQFLDVLIKRQGMGLLE
ncbi:uncharacterized protein [Eleutherodactylus coqui]|uniref:uncharacterized protein n=1 Tax=Eleutherodactylus coqui TaxID=57060 RepID=UPI0034620DE3